jgi:hypothetical protein
MDVNLFGVVHGLNTLLPLVTSHSTASHPSSVIITGSKQGITNPPGNPAYNASKAAIKSLAEHLSFDLSKSSPTTSVHLLVPGWTFTGMSGNDPSRSGEKEKPKYVLSSILNSRSGESREQKPAPRASQGTCSNASSRNSSRALSRLSCFPFFTILICSRGAWWPEQVIDYLEGKMEEGRFYVICPDNDVSEEMDKKRMLWDREDLVRGRPPLTRWREDYAIEAENWIKETQI